MKYRRFHPIAAVRFLRRTLALYLFPLVPVLFARDWPALRAALRQEAALFAFLLAVSALLLGASGWRLDADGTVRVHWALGARWERAVPCKRVSAVCIERPLLYRMAGASRVTLYPAGETNARRVVLCVTKRDAQALADALLPAPLEEGYRPASGERLILALLGANGFSTLLLLAQAVAESERLSAEIHALALAPVNHLAAFAAHWLPAGTAWLLAAIAALWSVSFARSFAQTAHFEVWSGGGVVASRGGLLGVHEYRMRREAVRFAQVRVSPLTRLLRRWPVYAAADGFCPELPLLVCRAGDEAQIGTLLPGFTLPPRTRADTNQRSLMFFAPAGAPLAVLLLLTVLASRTLPALVPPLALAAALCLAPLGMAVYGYLYEGAWVSGGHLTLCRQSGVYLYRVCAFGAPSLTASQSPWAAAAGRTDLTLLFPGKRRETVRSIPVQDARECFDFLEG